MKNTIEEKLRVLGTRGFQSAGSIELTSRCNLSCKYCYVSPVPEELTTTEVYHVIDRMVEAGILWVLLTGGEMFLRDDILDILTYVVEKNFFQMCILCNGTVLDDEHRAFLVKNTKYLQYIRFSFFSHVASRHDAFTGVPGSFDQSLSNAVKLQANGVGVAVIINLVEDNVDELNKSREFFLAKGFNVSVGLSKIKNNDHNRSCCDPLTSRSFFKRYFDQSTEKMIDGLRGYFKECCDDRNQDEQLCGRLFGNITILAGGEIVPCLAFRNIEISNIRSDKRPFHEIFRHSTLIRHLRSLKRSNLPQCANCKFKNFCSFCPGLMYSENGTTDIPLEQMCNYAHEMYEKIHS